MERVSQPLLWFNKLFLPFKAKGGRARAFEGVVLFWGVGLNPAGWTADTHTQKGERPFSWMTHSVVLHYWDPGTITRLSHCCGGRRSPETVSRLSMSAEGIIFMFYAVHNRNDRRDSERKVDEYTSEFLWGRRIRLNYIKHESLISN